MLFVFALMVALNYWWRTPSSPEQNNERSKARHQTPPSVSMSNKGQSPHIAALDPPSRPTTSPSSVEAQKKLIQHEKKQRSLPQTKSEKSPNAISFKAYHGLAIAYGDVLLGKLQEEVTEGYTTIPAIGYWPNPVIPYHIQPSVVHPERILKALAYLSEKTVLEFVPLDDGQVDAIVFEVTEENCFSYVGRVGGAQPVYVSPKCDWHHVVHEVLHAIGLVHEHSRPDRDQFISIQWQNIPQPYHSQFEVLPEFLSRPWLSYPYDSASLMHYGSQTFITETGFSLLLKDGRTINEPMELSTLDIQKVNDLFR